MQRIHASHSASITELKKNPSSLLSSAKGEPIAILNHNKPMAYLIPAERYELILKLLEDHNLNQIADARMNDGDDFIEVDEL